MGGKKGDGEKEIDGNDNNNNNYNNNNNNMRGRRRSGGDNVFRQSLFVVSLGMQETEINYSARVHHVIFGVCAQDLTLCPTTACCIPGSTVFVNYLTSVL